MEEVTICLSITLKTAESILSSLKSLKELKSELEIEIKKNRYKGIKYIPGPLIEILKKNREKTIRECYLKYKKLGSREMIRRTRKEVKIYPWSCYDLVYADLKKVKNELEPKKGQIPPTHFLTYLPSVFK